MWRSQMYALSNEFKWKLFYISLIFFIPLFTPQIIISHNCFHLGIHHNLDLSAYAR